MDKNRYLVELSSSASTDFGRVDFAEQGHEQRVFTAIWGLESEVNSGGFASYFKYEEPAIVAFAPAALKAIGAHACADIVERALQVAAAHDDSKLEDQLEALDQQFYGYPDNLTELLYEFVVGHPDAFGQPASS
jgi:hypothetical protein